MSNLVKQFLLISGVIGFIVWFAVFRAIPEGKKKMMEEAKAKAVNVQVQNEVTMRFFESVIDFAKRIGVLPKEKPKLTTEGKNDHQPGRQAEVFKSLLEPFHSNGDD